MTDDDLLALHEKAKAPPLVRVTDGDVAYDGWLVMVGTKRNGSVRCIVEDAAGRLFVQNSSQVKTTAEAEVAPAMVRAIVYLLPDDREAGLRTLDHARHMVERFKR